MTSPIDKAFILGVQASQDGFDWRDPVLAMAKVQEEFQELLEALQNNDSDATKDELGDLLFSVVQVARLAKVDASQALEQANEKFIRRYEGMKKLSENQAFATLSLDQQMQLWQRVKQDRT